MSEARLEPRGSAASGALLLLMAVLLLPGCDGIREKLAGMLAGAGQDGAQPAGEVPEGWESIEGSASAKRLYYQFNDARGQVRFVERLDEVPEAVRASVGFVKLDVPPPLSPADARQARNAQIARRGGVRTVSAAAPKAGQPLVIVYYADWCPACRKAKAYLNRKGVPFQLRNVDNPAAKQELVRKTGRRSIPVIDVDGRILTGFSPQAIDALLGSA